MMFYFFKVNVQPGDKVKKGDILMVMEAMKMEVNALTPLSSFFLL